MKSVHEAAEAAADSGRDAIEAAASRATEFMEALLPSTTTH